MIACRFSTSNEMSKKNKLVLSFPAWKYVRYGQFLSYKYTLVPSFPDKSGPTSTVKSMGMIVLTRSLKDL